MIEAPIFHVNGDDPEAAVSAMRLALALPADVPQGRRDRSRLLPPARPQRGRRAGRDAAGDVHRDPRAPEHARALRRKLIEAGVIDAGRRRQDGGGLPHGARRGPQPESGRARHDRQPVHGRLEPLHQASLDDSVDTGLPDAELARLAGVINTVPPDAQAASARAAHRRRAARAWPRARSAATGASPRTSRTRRCSRPTSTCGSIGQDSRRGTFFHRHAALIDQTTGEPTCRSRTSRRDPRAFTVADSLLSEEAVLGFEYGYSTTSPDTLVIWEAQFGDFVNGAQVVIDQFISSGEAKWGRLVRAHAVPAARLRRARARSTRRRASSASCSCAPSTTCRSACRRRRRRCSTCCAGRCCGTLRKPLDRHDAEEPAAPQAVGVDARGSRARPLPTAHRRDRAARRRRGYARRVLQRQGVFRSAEHRRNEGIDERRDRAHRAALSVPDRRVRARASRATATRRKSSGARKSRRTRAPGTRSAIACRSRSADRTSCSTPAAPGAAAPATGIHALHVRQQQALVSAALTSSTHERAASLSPVGKRA